MLDFRGKKSPRRFRIMDLYKGIEERRSIRKYKKDPVSDESILKCIEGARLAPSWHNTQVWRFVVIKDQGVKEAVAGTLASWNPSRQALLDAPVAICLVAQRNRSGILKGEAVTDKGDWFMFDCGIAMEHLVLTAWDLGLGTVHVGAFDSKKVEEILAVPEGYSVVAMTPLGFPDEQPGPRPRKAAEELLFLDAFGKAYTK
jgi:nitroreductase